MRWLMIALLVSLGALLLAAAGAARHILRHRAKLQNESRAGYGADSQERKTAPDRVEETDQEL